MVSHILICDDSSFAQKQLMRALPDDWDIDVSYAKHGEEALQILAEKNISVLFLDLNMPILDGYGVLAKIRELNHMVRVVVVSGDIQSEAYNRVMDLGAIEFIKKPVDSDEVERVIREHKLDVEPEPKPEAIPEQSSDQFDAYREITNVALGQAASLLAKVLDHFVIMPIPSVNMIEITELQMAVDSATHENVSAVCQGFIGGGLAGEALLLFSDSSYADMAKLMHYEGEMDDTVEVELLTDLANILIGACMKGIAEQFDISLSLGHPTVLGRHVTGKELIQNSNSKWKSTLAIDMQIAIEHKQINTNLLLLFTEDSIARFDQLISYAAA